MKDPTLLTVLWSVIAALASIVGLTVRSILTGRLVPRSAVEDIRADREKWETAWHLSQQTMTEFAARVDANTEALRLVERILDALVARGPAR